MVRCQPVSFLAPTWACAVLENETAGMHLAFPVPLLQLDSQGSAEQRQLSRL